MLSGSHEIGVRKVGWKPCARRCPIHICIYIDTAITTPPLTNDDSLISRETLHSFSSPFSDAVWEWTFSKVLIKKFVGDFPLCSSCEHGDRLGRSLYDYCIVSIFRSCLPRFVSWKTPCRMIPRWS